MAYKLSYFVGPNLSPLPLVLEMEFQLEVGGLFLGVFYWWINEFCRIVAMILKVCRDGELGTNKHALWLDQNEKR